VTNTNSELHEELLRSNKFLEWRPAKTPIKKKASYGSVEPFVYIGERYTNLVVDEKHFTPADLAAAWGVSAETVRQIFRNEPDVLRVGSRGPVTPSISRRRRSYVLLRIPESVALRVHKRLSAVPK
jgi:hypothetical protein